MRLPRRSVPIHAATFSFPRPLGSSIPRAPVALLASLRGEGGDVTGSIARNPLGQVIRPPQPHEFPIVDRTAKGDRLSSKGDRLSIKRPEAEITVAPQAVQPEDEGAANPAMPAQRRLRTSPSKI